MTDGQEPAPRGPVRPSDGARRTPRARRPAGPAPPGRNRTARFAWGAVAVILVAVIALVTYALTDPTP